MAYQMAAMAVTLNDLEGHSLVAGLSKCNPSNIYAAFYTISTSCKIVTHENFSSKVCTVQISVKIGSVGASSQLSVI